MKTCSRCKKEKPLKAYRKRIANKDGLEGQCTDCKNLLLKLRRRGLTDEEYEILVKTQTLNGILVCPVCLCPEPEVLDHDHDTMKVRGIVHKSCNSLMGAFNDDPILLEKASAYLIKSSVMWLETKVTLGDAG